MHDSRVLYLKYYMHDGLFFSNKLLCTVFRNAICTAVCFSLEKLSCTIFCSAICTAVCFSLKKKKKLPCTLVWNAICTAVCFSLKKLPCTVFWNAICTAVLEILPFTKVSSPFCQNCAKISVYILKHLVHGSSLLLR